MTISRDVTVTDLVECHSGYTYGERPIALYWDGERLEVAGILDRVRTPDGKYFRVHTKNDQAFELFYDENHDEWEVELV